MAVLPSASRAVTVTSNGAPAVAAAGAGHGKWVAGPARDGDRPEVPVIDGATESVPVMVWLPAVARVAPELKVWTPLSPATKV